MNYKSFNLGDWIGHISGVIEDESELDGNEMRDLVEFLSGLPRWIPVSERLPKKDKQVLCCNKQGSVFTSAITFQVGNMVAFGQHPNIIAWMPLPEPFKAESEEADADSN